MDRALDRSANGWKNPPAPPWDYLAFELLLVEESGTHELEVDDREMAIITLAGAGVVEVEGQPFELSRRGVFEEMASLLYVAPGTPVSLAAEREWHVAVGSAPASGRYPTRLITPAEMDVEVRGGGPALRQVNHLLAYPLPAERLIVYEVYVPGGAWAGWPPHCHDGSYESPYLEETYLFQFDRSDGFGFHRNYLLDGSYDEVFTVGAGDCIAVPRGFHVTAAAPGHNMWILNFLAGEPTDGDRARPPYFDPQATWIMDDWSAGQIDLPAVTSPDPPT